MGQTELDRIVTNIREQVKEEFVTLKSHMIENNLTKQQAADYLKINIKTLEARIRQGIIPRHLVHRNGGTVYFFASELKELLKKS